MRIVIALVLLVHALIHLMGFLSAWKLAEFSQLRGATLIPLSAFVARAVGALWLAVAVVLLVASWLRMSEQGAWWNVAAVGVAVSQALIVLQWQDAKAGSLVNLVLLVAIVLAASGSRFRTASDNHTRALLAHANKSDSSVLSVDDVAALPDPVRRWLHACGAVGRTRATTVRLLERGGLRAAPDQPYMEAEAQQYFSVDPPGFVWTVDVTMKHLPVLGRDEFVNGHGRMLITLFGLVPVVDATGPRIDQGTALRYLGEIIWFPSAAVSPAITWQAIDDHCARATLRMGDVEASAVFEFDDRGRFRLLTAKRYLDGKSLETWEIPATEWRTVRGIEMPVRGNAVWKLKEGDFDYFQWEIVDVESNTPQLWPRQSR